MIKTISSVPGSSEPPSTSITSILTSPHESLPSSSSNLVESQDQSNNQVSISPTPPNPPIKIGPLACTNETRIVYHVDDEETPYLVKLPIPHSQIKLSDFKSAISLTRPHYKFFFKSYDKEVGVVKEEIFDDNASLPIFKDRVVAWLVSTEGSTISDSTNSQCQTEISATGRIHPHHAHHQHRSSQERNGLIRDSHPSFHNNITDHFTTTATETESMLSSRNGNHSNLRRGHKSGGHHGKYNRYHGNDYYYGHHDHHHHYMDSSVLTSDMESTSFVDSDDDDDLLDTGVDDDNDYDDYTSRISTTTEETSVSRQYSRRNRQRRRQKGSSSYFNNRNRMSRTSSLSSITESSMSLNIIQVILNLDTVNYLGISLVGQTSKKGDGGIYVSSILKGGAVALDGRIEPGDMILQVNDINLENLTNDEAVEVIREAVKKPGPIKLLVAKCWDPHPRGHFTIPRSEPVRPIDPGAWVAHTEAARAKFTNPDNFPINLPPASNFILNAPPISSSLPDSERQIFQQSSFNSFTNTTNSYPLPASSVSDSNSLIPGSPLRSSFKSCQSTLTTIQQTNHQSTSGCIQMPSAATLTIESDLETIAYAMASPNSGLDVRDRMWLKISIPSAFIGSDVVEWLYSSVSGLHDRKDAKKLASKLLKAGYICHTINLKSSFSEKCYYIFSEQLQQINKSSTVNINSTADFNSVSQPILAGPNTNQTLPSNFDEKFANALRLKNDHFEASKSTTEQVSSNFDVNIAKTRGKLPFMCYWDEKSEIRNYGLFGPQPSDMMIRNDGTQSNHSGGNRSHDQYQSDEQMSQQSGQSILYNAQAVTKNNQNINMPTNTIKSSGSNGSSQMNSGPISSNIIPNSLTTITSNNSGSSGNHSNNSGTGNIAMNSSNNNMINHHYEDLQMNPITGNLVSTSIVNNDSVSTNNGETIQQYNPHCTFARHVEGNEAAGIGIEMYQTNKNVPTNISVNNDKNQEGRPTLASYNGHISQHQQSSRSSGGLPTHQKLTTANIMRNSFKKAIGKS